MSLRRALSIPCTWPTLVSSLKMITRFGLSGVCTIVFSPLRILIAPCTFTFCADSDAGQRAIRNAHAAAIDRTVRRLRLVITELLHWLNNCYRSAACHGRTQDRAGRKFLVPLIPDRSRSHNAESRNLHVAG